MHGICVSRHNAIRNAVVALLRQARFDEIQVELAEPQVRSLGTRMFHDIAVRTPGAPGLRVFDITISATQSQRADSRRAISWPTETEVLAAAILERQNLGRPDFPWEDHSGE